MSTYKRRGRGVRRRSSTAKGRCTAKSCLLLRAGPFACKDKKKALSLFRPPAVSPHRDPVQRPKMADEKRASTKGMWSFAH